MIKKIRKLNKGIFRFTNWQDSHIPDFKKFNLIYGWNGTGKTTLANALRTLEKPPQQSDVQFDVTWETTQQTKVRVFNKQFIEENIFKIDRNDKTVSPIYVLGEGNVHIQQRIDRLEKYWKEKLEKSKALYGKDNPENGFEKFCTQEAKKIKEMLRGGNNNRFNNYFQNNYKIDINKIKPSETQALISDEERDCLLKSTQSTKLDKLSELAIEINITQEEIDLVCLILNEKASANFIDELLENINANKWVSSGIELHKDRDNCFFCDSNISSTRKVKLNEHFNDAVKNLEDKINQKITNLSSKKTSLDIISLPKNTEFYPDLKKLYQPKILQDVIKKYIEKIDSLIELLNKKLTSLHEPLANTVAITPIDGSEPLNSINTLIKKHNKKTDNLDEEINDAREKYAKALLIENYQKYHEYQEKMKLYKSKLEKYKLIIVKIDNEVSRLTTDIRSHRKPAEKMNEHLWKYLGHNELQLAVKENGYEIHRQEQEAQAESLCESERTSIALIFFLNSLNDENFDLTNGVVILDDPISSLDNKAIFTAFTFIKEHLKNAGQLFLLTHNFEFMNQVKRWLVSRYIKQSAFFMFLIRFKEKNNRYADLIAMDELLKDYQSEYHYNFKVIYQCSLSDTKNLVEYMPIPNVLRKLIETFSAFQFPNRNNNYLDSFETNPTEKGKLERFLNVMSHSDSIGVFETMNDHYLQDTKQICERVLNKINEHNTNHYIEMLALILK